MLWVSIISIFASRINTAASIPACGWRSRAVATARVLGGPPGGTPLPPCCAPPSAPPPLPPLPLIASGPTAHVTPPRCPPCAPLPAPPPVRDSVARVLPGLESQGHGDPLQGGLRTLRGRRGRGGQGGDEKAWGGDCRERQRPRKSNCCKRTRPMHDPSPAPGLPPDQHGRTLMSIIGSVRVSCQSPSCARRPHTGGARQHPPTQADRAPGAGEARVAWSVAGCIRAPPKPCAPRAERATYHPHPAPPRPNPPLPPPKARDPPQSSWCRRSP